MKPIIGQHFQHRFLTSDQPTGLPPQLPNEFIVAGLSVDGRIGLVQIGQTDPSPTWWEPQTFEETFVIIT